MSVTVKVEGLRDLDAALADLTKAAGKGALRRAMKTAAQPMAKLADQKKPGDGVNINVEYSTKLSDRQAAQHRKMFRNDKASVEGFVGAVAETSRGEKAKWASNPAAHLQEFGAQHHRAQPFMRPAWDQDHRALLVRLGEQMRIEIDKAMERARRKAARLAGRT